MSKDNRKSEVRELPENYGQPEWMDNPDPPELIGFDERFRQKIQSIIAGAVRGEPRRVSDDDWAGLETILTQYARKEDFRRGFVRQGQATALAEVSKAAQKLTMKLNKAAENDALSLLDDQLQPDERDMLLEYLNILGKVVKPKSPYGRKEASELVKDNAPELIGNLAHWWERVTGRKASIDKEQKTPFNEFVENACSVLPDDETEPGFSAKAISNRKRQYEDQVGEFSALYSRYQAALATWQASQKRSKP